MVITLAADRHVAWRPGFYRGPRSVRMWWLWFAVAYYWRDEQWLVCESHGWAERTGEYARPVRN